MVGLILAIIIINTVAFFTVKRLSINQKVHMWTFTIVFQLLVDLYLGLKYHGYWYIDQAVGWSDLLPLTLLGPPTVLVFLNNFPFHSSFLKRLLYILVSSLILVTYEAISLLPEPWGYFRYGWWELKYSVISYPFLLVMILFFYKWICRIEKTKLNG